MEDVENKRKKLPVQIVVAPAIKVAIEDESTRLSRSEERKVTEGEVVQRAFRMYKASLTPELALVIPDPIGRYTDTEREWLRDFMLTGMTALEIAKGTHAGKSIANEGKNDIDSLLKKAREEENRTFKTPRKRKEARSPDIPDSKRTGKRSGGPSKQAGGGSGS